MEEQSKEIALQAAHITKEYKLYDSEWDRLKEAFNPFKKSYHKPFFALKDINISIYKGEKVGIIGSNGAGKSTFLKIMTEVLRPTEGNLTINGKVAALLELGAGFNPDYTGIENIRLNGKLMGLTEDEISERMQKIVDFADIGEFVKQPVKNYSSGMFVRLAFATQIFSEPDILIVDEALSVGDIRFQQKCYRAMDQLMKDKTVVLVTHDTAAVTRFCQRVIWINHGQVMFDGDTAEGLKKYQEFIINKAIDENSVIDDVEIGDKITESDVVLDFSIPEVQKNLTKMGNGKADISHCGLFDDKGKIIDIVEPGQIVDIASRIEFFEEINRPLYGITLKDRLGNVISCLNSEMLGVQLPRTERAINEYHLKFAVPELNKGEYTVSVAIANGIQIEHIQLCWVEDVIVFRVSDRPHDLPGFFYLTNGSIEVKRLN